MAALTPTTPTNTGTVVTGSGVASSDTIATAVMGRHGCYLTIINGNASPDSVTISDSGATPAGNSPGTIAGSVTNATSKVFFIHREQANPATGLVTVTHSVTATVSYWLFPV